MTGRYVFVYCAMLVCGACEVAPSSEALGGRAEDPAAVDAEVQRVFDDAACWCESYLFLPYEAADTPASLRARRLYLADVTPLEDPRLMSFVASTSTLVGEFEIRECDLSPDAARGALSDRRWAAADTNSNACTGWPTSSISHALCRAEFDNCLGQELSLAADSSTRPLPPAVRDEVRAESVRRLQSAGARSLAELVRLRGGACPMGSTDPDCIRLATGYEQGIRVRVSDAASSALTAAHELVLDARREADTLTPGLVEGTSYGAEMFGPVSSRVAMMQRLYGNTLVADALQYAASFTTGPAVSASIQIAPAPPSLLPPAFRAIPIRLIAEQDDLRLEAPLTLSGPGAPTLPAGSVVDVWLVHFASTGTVPRQTGTITFNDRRVLGVLTTDAQLIATHPTLGRAGTTYWTGAGVGTEAPDTVTVGVRTVQLDLTVSVASTIDELRIVTVANPDPVDTVISAERRGELPFAARTYGDVRTPRALGLLAQHRIVFPHTACLSASNGEVTNAVWDANPRAAAPSMLAELEAAVRLELQGPSAPGPTSLVLETYGVGVSDIADAIDYVRDAESVLDGLVLAPISGCGPSIVRPAGIAQRNVLPLQAAFARSGTGALAGSFGTSWYTPSTTQLRDIGTVGASQMLRMQLATAFPTDPTGIAAANDTLALIDTEIGPSWTEWRICEDASCDSDPQFAARWSLYERAAAIRPAGVAVLVASASDARCLAKGHEPLAPSGAACGHVTSSASRYTPMTPLGSGCTSVGPYCRRSFTLPNMRTAAPDDRRFVFWCARETTDPAGTCRSHELVDVIYTGAGPQVHAFGGEIGAEVAKSFAVDPNDPAIPMFNSLGFAHDFVPPLENELTDDDDAREDSWRTYLASADRAQAEASALLQAARQHELEQLAFERTVEAQLESAELAQQETVSAICGADTPEADCNVATTPRVRLGPSAGGVPGLEIFADPGPSATFSFSGGPYDCTNVVGALDHTSGPSKLLVLRAIVGCARWQAHAALSTAEVHDVPTAVFDAVLATSRSGVPGGEFTGAGGNVRQKLIELYQNFEGLRAFSRSLDSSVATVLTEIDILRNKYNATENGWFEGGFGCILRMVATIATAFVAIAATGGVAGVALAGAVIKGVGSILGEADACADADLERKNLVLSATTNMLRGVEAIAGLGDHARALLGKLASADAAFDDMARQVELARRRREIAERLATSGVAGDPTWRALLGVERRRADEALANAQRYAFVARRAIETRLAIDMTSMTSPEPYVDGPAFWVNDVFDLGNAIEYVPVDGQVVAVDVRAEELEDYLHSLGSFVDGYPFNHRFSEGDDVQIVNLGEVVPPDPFSTGFVDPPYVSKVLFRCRNSTDLLPGGVPSGFVVADPLDPPEPCGVFTTPTGTVDLGGVESASFSFAIPVDLDHGYFGDRFSGGNFNYRIRDLSVNLVGRALFDCERAARPTECYGDGNLQYSMRHEGETVLESWDGDQRLYAFEPGVLTRARALADERWLTNPLSSTDSALIAPYTRTEWWGRPLAGTYTLEVQSRDEMDWRNLENVQVLLRYHYWTHQR